MLSITPRVSLVSQQVRESVASRAAVAGTDQQGPHVNRGSSDQVCWRPTKVSNGQRVMYWCDMFVLSYPDLYWFCLVFVNQDSSYEHVYHSKSLCVQICIPEFTQPWWAVEVHIICTREQHHHLFCEWFVSVRMTIHRKKTILGLKT